MEFLYFLPEEKNYLWLDQDKLIDFLTKFHTDRSEDEQFNDEKAYLIKQIRELKPITQEVS